MGMRVTLSTLFMFVMMSFGLNANAKYPNGICPTQSIDYCGQTISGTACVDAQEVDARQITPSCPPGTRSVWYLANSDYKLKFDSRWLCSNEPPKKELCARTPNGPYRWVSTGGDNGICQHQTTQKTYTCGIDKDPSSGEAKNEDYAQKCSDAGGQYKSETWVCYCPTTNKNFDPLAADARCDAKTEKTAEKTESATPPIVDCVKKKIAEVEACVALSKETKVICEKYKEENANMAGISSVAQTVLKIKTTPNNFNAAQDSSSAQSQCALASLASSSLASLLSGFGKSCDEERLACNKTCDIETNLTKACESFGVLDEYGKKAFSAKDKKYVDQEQNDLSQKYGPANTYCQVKAKQENDILNQALNGAFKAQSAAQSCVCTTSSNGSGACGSTTEQCLANPALPDCPHNGGINCQLGDKDYSNDSCECLRDSASPKCPQAIKATVSSMGTALNAGSGSSVSGFGTGTGPSGGGGGFDNGNLDMTARRETPSLDETRAAKVGTGGESLGGAAGVGGGSGGGGGAAAPAAGGPEEEKANSGGFFGMVKSALGMGGGSGSGLSKGSSTGRNKDGLGFNPDKYKGLGIRGVAGGRVMGTPHMNIWDMMQERYHFQDKEGKFPDPSANSK